MPDPSTRTGLRTRTVALLMLGSALLGSCATLVATAPLQYLGHVQRSLASDGEAIRSWRPEATLPVRPRSLAGADSGTLLPGFTASTAEGSPAGWAVLDKMGAQVTLVHADGRVGRTLGRRGKGPGELDRPAMAVLAADGTVAVADALTRYIDVFPVDGDPYRVQVDRGLCPAGSAHRLWSSPGGGWALLRRCTLGVDIQSQLIEVAPSGGQVSHPMRPLSQASIDPFARPLAVRVDDAAIFVGSTRELCLRPSGGAGADSLCLPSAPPPTIPDSVRSDLFGDLPAKAALIGVDLETPDRMPGVMDVRETGRGPALRVVLADLSEAWAFREGDELVHVAIPDGVRAYPGWNGWLLLREELEGVRVWTVPYAGWVDGG
jgi:hypothetical protein